MKVVTQLHPYSKTLSPHLDRLIDGRPFCILDIETMGLSSKFHPIILVGLLWVEEDQLVVRQYFAETPKEERDVLAQVAQDVEKMLFLITYNGISFDLPFLKERFDKHGLDWPFETLFHLDLLQLIRRYKQSLPLENHRLKTVETFLGINRRDTISGQESVALYQEYVKNPSKSLEKTILLHNYEDILHLLPVTGILDHFPPTFALWQECFQICSIKDHFVYLFYYPEDVRINRGKLCVKGKTNKIAVLREEIHFTPAYNFQWQPSEGSFQLSMELQKFTVSKKETGCYVNLESYFENVADFKSVVSNSPLIQDNLLIISEDTLEARWATIQLINELIKQILQPDELVAEEAQPAGNI